MFEHVGVNLGYDDLEANTSVAGRLYETPEGVKYPSITTVLSILSQAGIQAWRKRVGEEEANRISHRASTRGTAVHAIVEDYLNNVENYKDKYALNIIDNFLPLKGLLDTRIGKIYAQEVALFSHHLGVAGRVDCVAEFDGKISIIDFKTSQKIKPRKYVENYFMQEAAYAVMFEERTGTPITQLVTLIAVDNEQPQVFVEHRDNWSNKLLETIAEYKKRKIFGR
jgi:hypothetical protein